MENVYNTVRVPLHWSLKKFQGRLPDISQMRLFSSKNLSAATLATQVVLGGHPEEAKFDVFKYVDPLIGTSEGGET